ncbi:hypothetical protein DEJ48_18080 [Streptomyces venezuelae]|uniref:Secreted protein n=1 Tax=Streptomyces venezuelae TaxID=54571 RepID=A0A5P2BXX6_STRVZ|nr:hypothetical protein [Streptomyces venezuelae]QES35063.1 hypothetical protein DEJ48_18080 [Streptomyces venezuelae]
MRTLQKTRFALRAAVLCALPTAVALGGVTPAQAADSVTVLRLTAAAGEPSVQVRYRCDALTGLDSVQVGVSDTQGGGVFQGTAAAVCDGTSHVVRVRTSRAAGPPLVRGHECVVSASLGMASLGMFAPAVSSGATKTAR